MNNRFDLMRLKTNISKDQSSPTESVPSPVDLISTEGFASFAKGELSKASILPSPPNLDDSQNSEMDRSHVDDEILYSPPSTHRDDTRRVVEEGEDLLVEQEEDEEWDHSQDSQDSQDEDHLHEKDDEEIDLQLDLDMSPGTYSSIINDLLICTRCDCTFEFIIDQEVHSKTCNVDEQSSEEVNVEQSQVYYCTKKYKSYFEVLVFEYH